MDTSVTYTLGECIDHIGLGKFQWRIISILGFCSMIDAVEMMLLAVLGPALRCYWSDVTEFQIATLTTSVFAGMMCGAFLFGSMADKYGRRSVILASTIALTVLGISTAFSPNFYWVLGLRILVGFTFGGSVQSTTLLLEYLPLSTRGNVFTMLQIFWSIGSIFVYVMAMTIVQPYGWRLLTILAALPTAIVAVSIYFVPESPRYYVASGQQEKAEDILKKMALTNGRPLPPGRLVDNSAEDECGSIKELFHISLRRTTLLLAFMWVIVTMSYYGLVLINTSLMTIFNDNTTITNGSSTIVSTTTCKMLTTDDYLSLIFTTFGEILGIPLLLVMLPRFGRRTISIINYSASSIFFALFFFIPHHSLWLVNIVSFMLRMFNTVEFIVMYLYTGEVYPTVVRAIALGAAAGLSRIGAMIAPYLSQFLIRETFSGTITIYVVTSAVAALFAYLLPIETKERALKQTISETNIASLASENDAAASSWVAPADHVTSLINANNGSMNKTYESTADENINNTKKE